MKSLIEFTERFGNMISRAFLTLLYYAVLGPFALLYQLFSDPLRIARPKGSNWVGWKEANESIGAARRQD